MSILTIKTNDSISIWFPKLEKRGLIRTLTHTPKIARSKRGRGAVDTIYSSSPRFGPHTLICVKPDSPLPRLNSHPDNEEFILLDQRKGRIRPLYMLIGLLKHEALLDKARRGGLSGDDFVLLKMPFNEAGTCVFIMCRDTVHCEIVFPGAGNAPVFFVTEPGNLPLRLLPLPGYSFSLIESRQ